MVRCAKARPRAAVARQQQLDDLSRAHTGRRTHRRRRRALRVSSIFYGTADALALAVRHS